MKKELLEKTINSLSA